MEYRTVPCDHPQAKRLPTMLAFRFLDLAIESGATYQEIREACEIVPKLMEDTTSPQLIHDGNGERTIAILQEP